ncbi:TRAP transporter small permease [Microbacterium sp. A93]|uniref:TRAP transporter small permease n=1 Tax=Microbacterium sp. A93 TaxID=3450716 RepID=UPI003F43D937
MSKTANSATPAPAHTLAGVARALERATLVVEPVLRTIASIGVLLLMIATVVDVSMRTLAGHGVPGVIEITEVLLVVTVFLAMMSSGRDGQHIRVTLLTDRLPEAAARLVRSIGLVLSLMIVGWLTWATIDKAIVSLRTAEYRFGLINVPIWPARVAIPIGLVCLAIVLIFLLTAELSKYSSVVGREREPFEDLLDAPITKDLA